MTHQAIAGLVLGATWGFIIGFCLCGYLMKKKILK